MQKLFRSKTIIFSAVLSALGVIQASMGVFTPYLSPDAIGLLTVIVGMAVAVLRVVTKVPLSDK